MIKAQDGINSKAIVIWRKKFKNYSTFTFMTEKKGLITCAVPHRHLKNMKNAGYLRPFSYLYITVIPSDDENFNLLQVDGIYAIPGLESDLENIAYASIGGELVMSLMGKNDVDLSMYQLLLKFSHMVKEKPFKLGLIILGWQILTLTGFTPSKEAILQDKGMDEFYLELGQSTSITISLSLKKGLVDILSYTWSNHEVINLSKYTWSDLEKLLYAYVAILLGHELRSVQFLRNMVS